MSLIFTILTALSILLGNHIDEDSPLFNCHVNGNHQCGPNAPADGYINLDLPR